MAMESPVKPPALTQGPRPQQKKATPYSTIAAKQKLWVIPTSRAAAMDTALTSTEMAMVSPAKVVLPQRQMHRTLPPRKTRTSTPSHQTHNAKQHPLQPHQKNRAPAHPPELPKPWTSAFATQHKSHCLRVKPKKNIALNTTNVVIDVFIVLPNVLLNAEFTILEYFHDE